MITLEVHTYFHKYSNCFNLESLMQARRTQATKERH